jgi:hypothetical protein
MLIYDERRLRSVLGEYQATGVCLDRAIRWCMYAPDLRGTESSVTFAGVPLRALRGDAGRLWTGTAMERKRHRQ